MNRDRDIVLVAHNLRSCHNVGSLLRTAEGLGVTKVIFSGYTPYPMAPNDARMPHEAGKINKQISKTALGAENSVQWEHTDDIFGAIGTLKVNGYQIFALEQTEDSIKLPGFTAPDKIAIIAGREVEGLEPEVISACDGALEIPMFGKKESYNVTQAAAMCLFYCRFY